VKSPKEATKNGEEVIDHASEPQKNDDHHEEGKVVQRTHKYKGSGRDEEINSFITSSIARLMGLLVFEKFANFHGSQGARLSRRQTVRPPNSFPGETRERTTLMKILSPVLFFAPEIHLKNIEDIWIDRMVLHEYWKAFVANLIREWEGLVLYSTVLLNANVAFLALPSVASPTAGAAEIASQVSIITSIGSIISSMLLARYHKPKEESGEGAAHYIRRKGLHNLAIMYSLPFALLMWSMVTFAVAIMITCFNVHRKSQKAITGAGWMLISMLIGWLIIVSHVDFGTPVDNAEDPPVGDLDTSSEGLRPTTARWRGVKSWMSQCSEEKRCTKSQSEHGIV